MAMQPLTTNASFGDLLRHILIFEKQQPLQHVAAALGMTVHAFCSRLRSGGRLGPDDVAVLLRQIPDERLLSWFFAGSGLLSVKHTIVSENGGSMTLRQRTVTCAMDAISAICDLADTLEAGMLEGAQKVMIEQHLDHALGELLSIKLHFAPPSADHDAPAHEGVHENFGHLTNRVLLKEKCIRPQALADALNLSYQALHARLSGHVAFLPIELRQLFRLFPDPRLADYLLAGTAYTAILRPAIIESRIDSSPIRTGLLSLREMVEVLGALLLTEDTPGAAPTATAERHLDEAVRQLATLRWNVTYIGHRGVPRADSHSSKRLDAA
jgi:hypothetical protein